MKSKTVITAIAGAILWLCAQATALGALTYGTLDNFDVINDTLGDCHGFEIELVGIAPADVVYTFGAPYERYGDPTLVPTATGVIIRYAASYDPSAGVWSATTPYTTAPYLPNLGHSCWTGGVSDPALYYACGCDHFGASLNAAPTQTIYRWLVEAAPGALAPYGSNVSLPAPTWNVTPPAVQGAQPVAAAAIAPPPPTDYEFGDALWAKVFVTELAEPVEAADLDHMVVDDPNVNIVPNEPAEVEIEWVLLQASNSSDGEQEFGGGAEVGAGNEAVSRRFEFYKYTGDYDPETHEALCDNPDNCPGAVGDLIGTQNAAINLAGEFAAPPPPNQPPIANAGPDQAVYVQDTVLLDGSASSDPDGNSLTYSWAFVSKPAASTAVLTDPAAVSPSFVVDEPGTYVIGLTVNDGTVDSTVATITVITLNSPPVAHAGPDQTVRLHNIVALDGSGSSDVDHDPLTYTWAFSSTPAHSRAVLSGDSTATPTFKADKAGTYLLTLTVNDGTVDGVADTVRVDVLKGKK